MGISRLAQASGYNSHRRVQSDGWTPSPQPLIRVERDFVASDLSRDPGSIFGGLFSVCIRDDYVKPDRKMVAEGVLCLILGAVSSIVTTYVLSVAGILV